MKVRVVGTTDDPADSLDLHHQIAKSGFETKVVPTYRPDACLKVRTPDRVQAWAKRLAAATGKGADTFAGLIAGLDQRHDDFAAAGCRASDHGRDYLPDAACTAALVGNAPMLESKVTVPVSALMRAAISFALACACPRSTTCTPSTWSRTRRNMVERSMIGIR